MTEKTYFAFCPLDQSGNFKNFVNHETIEEAMEQGYLTRVVPEVPMAIFEVTQYEVIGIRKILVFGSWFEKV